METNIVEAPVKQEQLTGFMQVQKAVGPTLKNSKRSTWATAILIVCVFMSIVRLGGFAVSYLDKLEFKAEVTRIVQLASESAASMDQAMLQGEHWANAVKSYKRKGIKSDPINITTQSVRLTKYGLEAIVAVPKSGGEPSIAVQKLGASSCCCR